jgi:hypothetical protein
VAIVKIVADDIDTHSQGFLAAKADGFFSTLDWFTCKSKLIFDIFVHLFVQSLGILHMAASTIFVQQSHPIIHGIVLGGPFGLLNFDGFGHP